MAQCKQKKDVSSYRRQGSLAQARPSTPTRTIARCLPKLLQYELGEPPPSDISEQPPPCEKRGEYWMP
eukprot:SAG31_NODE_26512_length_441_cov_0.675439_1_plen_67_part_01